MVHTNQSINQSTFYFMSVHIKVILDNNKIYILVSYANVPTRLWTINLTTEVITLVLYKISLSLTLLQALKSYYLFWNNSVVIGHSNQATLWLTKLWLIDRTFLQLHVTFCEYLVFHEFRRNLYITLAKYLEQEGITGLLYFDFDSLFKHWRNLMRWK